MKFHTEETLYLYERTPMEIIAIAKENAVEKAFLQVMSEVKAQLTFLYAEATRNQDIINELAKKLENAREENGKLRARLKLPRVAEN